MEDDKHQSHVPYLSYFGKNHLFHIAEREFRFPKNSILGLPSFHKFPRYATTQKILAIDHYTAMENISQRTQQNSANFK